MYLTLRSRIMSITVSQSLVYFVQNPKIFNLLFYYILKRNKLQKLLCLAFFSWKSLKQLINYQNCWWMEQHLKLMAEDPLPWTTMSLVQVWRETFNVSISPSFHPISQPSGIKTFIKDVSQFNTTHSIHHITILYTKEKVQSDCNLGHCERNCT